MNHTNNVCIRLRQSAVRLPNSTIKKLRKKKQCLAYFKSVSRRYMQLINNLQSTIILFNFLKKEIIFVTH